MLFGYNPSTAVYSAVVAGLKCTTSACAGFQLFKFDYSLSTPTTATNKWLRYSSDVGGSVRHVGLSFSEIESYFYSYSYQNSKMMIARIGTATGTKQWVHEF